MLHTGRLPRDLAAPNGSGSRRCQALQATARCSQPRYSHRQVAKHHRRRLQHVAAESDRLPYDGGDAEVPPEQAQWMRPQPQADRPDVVELTGTIDADGRFVPDDIQLDAEAESTTPADDGQVTALGLLRSTWATLRGRLLAVLVLMSLQDAAIFGCQRLADLATNYGAVAWLRGPYTKAALGRMAWTTQDPMLSTFSGGYVWLHWLFQGAALPAKIAVQAAATASLFHLATSAPRDGQGRNPFKRLAHAVADAFAALRSGLSDWRRAYLATALVLLRFLPLGAASILIVPLYWTLPRVVQLQAAVPAAIAEDLGPRAALERSRQLVDAHVRAFAIPLLLLTLAPRAVLTGRHWLLAALPPRLWTQVQELPLLIAFGSPLLAIVLFRMQELLPIVAYRAAVAADGSKAQLEADTAAGNSSQGTGPPEQQ